MGNKNNAGYTIDDVKKSGYWNKMSDPDRRLAEQNPNAGMAIASAKKTGNNKAAEEARWSYGGYTGGSNGGAYILNPMSPRSYQADEWNDQYGGAMNKALKSQYDGGTFNDQYGGAIGGMLKNGYNAPQYAGKYDAATDELLSSVKNRGEFSYSVENDPAYQAYRSQYLREGRRAAQDTMAQAAAMTGGRPSSAAVTAAAQQQNYYNAQLTDKIPELYDQAYNRYLNEFQQKAQAAQMYQQQQQADYGRFNQERGFGYQQNQDQLQNLQRQQQVDYNIFDTNRNFDANQRQQWIQNMFNQRNQDRGIYESDRGFGYGQLTDEVNWQQQQRANEINRQQVDLQQQQMELNKALQAYQLGDNRMLQQLGIDTSKDVNRQIQEMQVKMQEQEMKSQQWQTKLQKAQAAAEYGDFGPLQAMGFDTSRAGLKEDIAVAQIIAQVTGDVSGLRNLMAKTSTDDDYDPYRVAMILG